jgi:formylglycine-generating enzyme required for sulfatase activity
MEFVRVPAGEFLMGSDPSKDKYAQPNEQPQHRVELSEYYIGKYEVTNAQYAVFAKEQRPNWQMPAGKENHPVVNVSWNDADDFTKWMSDKTGKTIRLPTEAEWEKACRGTDGQIYPWGDQFDAQKLNSSGGGAGGTTPVGKYSQEGDSPYDVADISGNVFEWTADWFDKTLYKNRPEQQSRVKDPTGPSSGETHVLRGGAFSYTGIQVRCAFRLGDIPDFDLYRFYGFRMVVRP